VVRALWIGRFQPFHLGHLDMARRILDDVDELLIAVGSAQYSHTPDNPFTAGERIEMIRRALEAERLKAYTVYPVTDTGVHSLWVAHVRAFLPPFDVVYTNSALVNRLFTEQRVKVLELPLWERDTHSGAEVRRRLREGGDWKSLVPRAVAEYLEASGGERRVREIGETRGAVP